jgi:hypothetical protein
MNFDDAMVAHMRWKFRLTDAIEGKSAEKLDPKMVCRDDQCDLGKWIHAPGQPGNDVDFAELKREHAVFHVQAAAVLDAIGAKKAQQAQEILNGPYSKVSANVIMLIKRLREKAA